MYTCATLVVKCVSFCWQTSSLYLHIFKVQFTEKGIQIGGKQPSGLFFIKISLVLSEELPFARKGLSV